MRRGPSVRCLALALAAGTCAGAPASAVISAPLPTSGVDAALATVDLGRRTLLDGSAAIERRQGDDVYVMMEARLNLAAGNLRPGARPSDYPVAQYLALERGVATLDAALIESLLERRPDQMASVRGAGDVWMRARADGSLQPVGLYVPASYDPRTPAPLVVFLHGRRAAEDEVVAAPPLQRLAERSGAIILAPYARGDAGYDGRAAQDVYDALDAALRAFTIDQRRICLAGFSMGAFAVFHLAALQPWRWHALLVAAGAMTDEARGEIAPRLRHSPVYLVSGSGDAVVTPREVRATARFLRAAGVPVREFTVAGGRHALHALEPALRRAWPAMLNEPA
ncbi:hypothetical protein EPN52_04860 [bacterium]|nr:MAG: hypothetical protein EPN52_04860 [bacterium]